MNWSNYRIHKRLGLNPAVIEEGYKELSEIDGVKNSWKITGRLLPKIIERLT